MKKSEVRRIIENSLAFVYEVDTCEVGRFIETKEKEIGLGQTERVATGWEEIIIKIRYKRN